MRRTTWPEFWHMRSMIGRGRGKEEDPLGTAQKYANLESTGLDIARKRRELGGPSPRDKDQEEQRSQQVGSALEMFGKLYKTASPGSKKRLTEQLTSLWGLMTPADQTKFKMTVSHTPINPKVQKAMWFEEANPRPTMDAIIRYQMPSSSPYGQPSPEITNIFERTPANRNLWAEYDIKSDEWNTLRGMAVEGKSAKDANWKSLPKQYQTENPKVTAYRDPVDKRVKYFDWSAADQAEILTAVENGWATQADMMNTGVIPLAVPKEYVHNGRPVTVRQVKEAVSGDTKLDYKVAGPMEPGKEAPKELTDAISLIDSGQSPESLKVKNPAVVGYYSQLKTIIKTSGRERMALQLDLQRSIAAKYPSEKRFIPFVPEGNIEGWWFRFKEGLTHVPLGGYFMPTPSGGKGGNVLMVQADRIVDFYDKNGKANKFWWSDINQVAFDTDGIPIKETMGVQPGSTLDLRWE